MFLRFSFPASRWKISCRLRVMMFATKVLSRALPRPCREPPLPALAGEGVRLSVGGQADACALADVFLD